MLPLCDTDNSDAPIYQPKHNLDFMMRIPTRHDGEDMNWVVNRGVTHFLNLSSSGYGVSGLVREHGRINESDRNYVYFFCPDKYFYSGDGLCIHEKFPRTSSYIDDKPMDFIMDLCNMVTVGNVTGSYMYIYGYVASNIIRKYVYFLCVTEEEQNRIMEKLGNFNREYHDIYLVLRDTASSISTINCFEKELMLIGLGDDGGLQEIGTDIILYGVDGYMYMSQAYQASYPHVQSDVPYELHFEPGEDYHERAHYLFDWMRPDYIGADGILNSAEIYGTQYDGNEAATRLENEYEPYEINGHPYYVPKLISYVNHQGYVRSLGIKNKCDVQLSMTVSNIAENFDVLENDMVEFLLPDGVTIDLKGIKTMIIGNKVKINAVHFKDVKHIGLTISCSKAISGYLSVNYLRGENLLFKDIGKMSITALATESLQTSTCELVKVKFKGRMKMKDNGNSVDFDMDTVCIKGSVYTLYDNTQTWVNSVRNNRGKIQMLMA